MLTKVPKYFLIVLIQLFGLSIHSVAQSDDFTDSEDKPIKFVHSKFFIRGNAHLPHPVSNAVFRSKFIGLFATDLSFNFAPSKKTYIALGYKEGLISISNKEARDLHVKMQLHQPFIGFDYSYLMHQVVLFNGGIRGGYAANKFIDVVCKTDMPGSKYFYTPYIEPEFGFNFLVEDNFGICISFSYTYYFKQFNPEQICLQEWTSLSGKRTDSNTQVLNLGFGFYYGFLKKKDRL